MSQACNTLIDIEDPATEQLKNREIELGSAEFFKAFSEALLLMSDVELLHEEEYASHLERALQYLHAAMVHYRRVLSIVESSRIRPQYVEWLRGLDYVRLHEERIRETCLPNETAIWDSVVTPNRLQGDAVAAFRDAFLARLEELQTIIAGLKRAVDSHDALHDGITMVPTAFWELQTRFANAMTAGQIIAVINALRPGDREWSAQASA